MAYAESPIGGSLGGQFRVWVNSIRTYDGGPTENVEDWRVEGGIKCVTPGSHIWNGYNTASYTIQLGLNGVAQSGNFSYDYGGGTGNLNTWGTGATRVGRNAAGVGFGFQSRTDVNLANSPYLTSGWVTSNDSVQTKYRHATLTALSMDAVGIPATDEGPMWIEFSNPSGASVDTFIEAAPSYARVFTSTSGQSSRYNFNFSGSLPAALQAATPNSNTNTVRIGVHDALGGDSYDYRERTYTIKNDTGQADPTYLDFDYLDTNTATVAVTGSNQILIQGKSTLQATVDVTDKATGNKSATMSSYLFSIGGYSQSAPWSNTLDVSHDIGVISDVSGEQTLSVRAIDSRGNGKTITKNVTVLPYASPGFYYNLNVAYANDFDVDSGLTVTLFNDTTLGSVSPMTLGTVDKNIIASPAGLRYDIAKDTGSYSGTWTNIPFTQDPGTGLILVDPAWLATSIEGRMNALTADNTVRWSILFEVIDKLETQYYIISIDVGRPFFRIGADGRLYYKEIEFFSTFSGEASLYYSALLAQSVNGTWVLTTPPAARAGGFAMFTNTSVALDDECYIDLYVPAGTYFLTFYFDQATTGGQITLNLDNQITFATNYETVGVAGLNSGSTGDITFLDGATYRMFFKVNGKATTPASYSCRLLGVKLTRV